MIGWRCSRERCGALRYALQFQFALTTFVFCDMLIHLALWVASKGQFTLLIAKDKTNFSTYLQWDLALQIVLVLSVEMLNFCHFPNTVGGKLMFIALKALENDI